MRGNFQNPFTAFNSKKSVVSGQKAIEIRKGGKLAEETQEEKFKKLVDQKKAKQMEAFLSGQKKTKGFQLPGTKADDGPRELSKTAQKLFKLMAEKKARKEAKKLNDSQSLKTKYFSSGGRMEKDGKIYDPTGKVIGTVDAKTGHIKNSWGMTIGKYKGDAFSNYRIERMAGGGTPPAAPTSTESTSDTSSGGGFWGIGAPKDDSWW